jgi:Complex I intermediate-associated protein 30 (CIA30)
LYTIRSSSAVFSGTTSPANNGGFASIRTREVTGQPFDWSNYDAIQLRVKSADDMIYKLCVYDSKGWDIPQWSYSFDTVKDKWIDVTLPFSDLKPIYRAKSMQVRMFEKCA